MKAHLHKKFEGVLDSPIMEKIFNAVFEFKISKRNG